MNTESRLAELMQQADAAGLTLLDFVTWLRLRDGIEVNVLRRTRLRETTEWRSSLNRASAITGLHEQEILCGGRQREYVEARDVLTELLSQAGWSSGDICSAMDKTQAAILAALERIRRAKRANRKAGVLV